MSSSWLRSHRSNAFAGDETGHPARMGVLAETGKPVHYNQYSREESRDVEPKKYSRKMFS